MELQFVLARIAPSPLSRRKHGTLKSEYRAPNPWQHLHDKIVQVVHSSHLNHGYVSVSQIDDELLSLVQLFLCEFVQLCFAPEF